MALPLCSKGGAVIVMLHSVQPGDAPTGDKHWRLDYVARSVPVERCVDEDAAVQESTSLIEVQ